MIFDDNKINLRPMSASREAWFTARMRASGSDDLCFLNDTPHRSRKPLP
ncbi:hypothetical protein U1708_03030 [Sphingomonas sp. ZB1N12]